MVLLGVRSSRLGPLKWMVVAGKTSPGLSAPNGCKATGASRNPTVLEQIVLQELETICQSRGLKHEIVSLQSVKPGRLVPTHRIV